MRVELFCEDRAHELFARELVQRLAREKKAKLSLHTQSARGGHPRALSEFQLWQKSLPGLQHQTPDLLVLIIDSNCTPWAESRTNLENAIDQTRIPHHVIGCPDPHIERWFIADPEAFKEVVGARAASDPGKCERHFYKKLVQEAIDEADFLVLTGIAEIGPDIVREMDLYRAGKNQPSLRHFVDGLRGAIRTQVSSP